MEKYAEALDLWQSYHIASAATLDKYLDSFRILFAFHSGKLKNDDITYSKTREIFKNEWVLNFTGNPRTLFEQQNQKLCYEVLKEKIINKDPLSVEIIKEIHKVLTSGTYDERRYIKNGERAGEFRKQDEVTGLYEVGSSAEAVESDLTELINEVNEYGGQNALKVATYLHAKFQFIHPFASGNGRVGRTLLNYYLMVNNHPPLIIYDEYKRFYYESLQKYYEDEELSALYEFLKFQVEKTWEKAIVLANDVKLECNGLSDLKQNV